MTKTFTCIMDSIYYDGNLFLFKIILALESFYLEMLFKTKFMQQSMVWNKSMCDQFFYLYDLNLQWDVFLHGFFY